MGTADREKSGIMVPGCPESNARERLVEDRYHYISTDRMLWVDDQAEGEPTKVIACVQFFTPRENRDSSQFFRRDTRFLIHRFRAFRRKNWELSPFLG